MGTRRTVAQAAASGTPRQEWPRVVIEVLKDQVKADRLGVWFAEASSSGDFRGIVWDACQETSPAEWSRLLPEISLFLRHTGTANPPAGSPLNLSAEAPIVGPLVEMESALWVPIERSGRWRGLLLAASRQKDAVFPRGVLESVAAELELALELEDERKISQERSADLELSSKVFSELAGGGASPELLTAIAEDCTATLGAKFSAIGRLLPPAEEAPQFLWKSGPDRLVQHLCGPTLQALCREPLNTGRTVTGDAVGIAAEEGIARIVVLPLGPQAKRLGVLVAGLGADGISLAADERLQLRAALAAVALGQLEIRAREVERVARPHGLVREHPDAMLLLDGEGHIVEGSKSAQLLFSRMNWKENQLLSQLFHERDTEAIAHWWQRHVKGAGGPATEGELASGTRVRLHSPIPAGDGLYNVLLEAAAPASESIAFSETELHTLLEWLEQGVVLFDAGQRIRAMNSRFAQLVGIDPREAARIDTLEALISRLAQHAAEPERLAEQWRELACLGEGGTREEIRLLHPTPRVLERAARPLLDPAGSRIGWLEIYRDLTAQRVFQSRLLQTEKLASLGQLVSGVAHELSNPLTTILGYAQRLLLREGAAPEEEIRRIYQEAERAGRILRQLLLSGRDTPTERRPVSLNRIIFRALDLLRFGLSPEKFRVEINLDPTLPLVLGDEDQLQQVILNLFINAQQAIEQQSGRGTILVETRRAGERRLHLVVSDTGPGVPASILARIFDPFFTTKPAGVGTGLGLSIVLGITREHGGQVHVVNRPGGGAAFTVELPALSQGEVLTAPPSVRPSLEPLVFAPKDSAMALATERPGARVLVVEDEPTVARLIADVLEDQGLIADVLLDGREALERADQREYDLLICDLKMPGIDGQHFYQRLVRKGSPLREHVIFVSGGTLSLAAQEFLEKNNLAYVAKPFHVDDLARAVREAFRRHVPAHSKSAAVRNE